MTGVLAYICTVLAALSPLNLDVKLITAKVEARYRSAHTLQATFLERYSEGGQLIRTEAGVAYFRRPGKMRWEYDSPEKNLFLVDGKTAWFYVPADHTVTRAPAKQSTDWRTPLALLAGEMKLSRVCARVEPATTEKPENPSNVVLFCKVRGEQEPDQGSSARALDPSGAQEAVYLEVEPNGGELAGVLVRERGGISVDFKFAAWRFDPVLPDSFFRFEVPRGVAIVNGETPEESRP